MAEPDGLNVTDTGLQRLQYITDQYRSKTIYSMKTAPFLFRIRTVTAFLSVQPQDFPVSLEGNNLEASKIADKVSRASDLLKTLEQELTEVGYEVQTLRLVTNPFGQWMTSNNDETSSALLSSRLDCWNQLMEKHGITFCSVGSASSIEEISLCVPIIKSSPYISCSAHVPAGDVAAAQAVAKCIKDVSTLPDLSGLGNFRFCMSNCKGNIPFFPAAKFHSQNLSNQNSYDNVAFALGLENGKLAQDLLKKTKSIASISTTFCECMTEALNPVQELCLTLAKNYENADYLGIDTSLNPSLDEGGSVAQAIEFLDEVDCFGGPGTLGAAAAITTALQTAPGIKKTGYCGLMLPVCEDQRLAELAATNNKGDNRGLELADLLSISSVCGVGIDTVPLAGDVTTKHLTSLLLDVAGLAERWDKSLSCRVLPFEGKKAGQRTDFHSPYMVNTNVFSL